MFLDWRINIVKMSTLTKTIQSQWNLHQNIILMAFFTEIEQIIGGGNGNPLQYSCLENPINREEPGRLQSMGSLSQTRLHDFTFTFCFHALEKEMVTHSSVLARRFPGTGETGGLLSMGSHRAGHDWSDLARAFWWLILLKYFLKAFKWM